MQPLGDTLEFSSLLDLKELFHRTPYFQCKWKTLGYRYCEDLELVSSKDMKPEMYNPRYLGTFVHEMKPSFWEKHGNMDKPVRLFWERIYCAGANNCSVVPENSRSNKKASKYSQYCDIICNHLFRMWSNSSGQSYVEQIKENLCNR